MHTISSRFGALLSTAFSLRGALAGAGRALYWRFAGNQFAFLGGTFAQNFLQAAVVPAHTFISRRSSCRCHRENQQNKSNRQQPNRQGVTPWAILKFWFL